MHLIVNIARSSVSATFTSQVGWQLRLQKVEVPRWGAVDSIALFAGHECPVAIARGRHNAEALAAEVSKATSPVSLPGVAVHVVVRVPYWTWSWLIMIIKVREGWRKYVRSTSRSDQHDKRTVFWRHLVFLSQDHVKLFDATRSRGFFEDDSFPVRIWHKSRKKKKKQQIYIAKLYWAVVAGEQIAQHWFKTTMTVPVLAVRNP